MSKAYVDAKRSQRREFVLLVTHNLPPLFWFCAPFRRSFLKRVSTGGFRTRMTEPARARVGCHGILGLKHTIVQSQASNSQKMHPTYDGELLFTLSTCLEVADRWLHIRNSCILLVFVSTAR